MRKTPSLCAALEDVAQLGHQRRIERRQVLDLLQEPRVLQVFDREKPREPGIGEEVPEGEAHQAVHGLDRIELAQRQLALAAADLLVGVEQHRRVERFLVAEVVVEQPLVGLGAGGDGIDPGAVEALLAELVARRLRISALVFSASRGRTPRRAPLRLARRAGSSTDAVSCCPCDRSLAIELDARVSQPAGALTAAF